MRTLQMLLAVSTAKQVALLGFIVVALAFAAVFIAGAYKGFMQVNKAAIVWSIAGVAFIVLYKYLPNAFANKLAKTALKGYSQLLWGILLLTAVVVAVLLVWVVLGWIFSTVEKEKKEVSVVSANSEGFEYQLDEVVDGYYMRKKTDYEIKRETSPGIISRIFGGFTAAANLAAVLGIVALFGLFVIETLQIKGGIESLVGAQLTKSMKRYILPYVVDFLMVIFIVFLASRGFRTGTIGLTRVLFLKFGIVFALFIGFAAPFFGVVSRIGLISKLINRSAHVYNKIPILPAALMGKLTAGAVFATAGIALVLVINVLLKTLIESLEETTILRVADGVCATLIYILIGIAICGIVWSGLYLLDASKIFGVESRLKENTLAMEFLKGAENTVGKFVKKYLLKFIR